MTTKKGESIAPFLQSIRPAAQEQRDLGLETPRTPNELPVSKILELLSATDVTTISELLSKAGLGSDAFFDTLKTLRTSGLISTQMEGPQGETVRLTELGKNLTRR